jgi:TonB family protein
MIEIKRILPVILILISSICYSQSGIKKSYYSDKYAKKESKNGKGKYVIIERNINDSIIQHEFIKKKTNATIWIKQFLNDEPYGEWKFFDEAGQVDHTFDYKFKLEYGEDIPTGFKRVDYKNKRLENKSQGDFKMPYLDNPGNGFQRYVVQNLRYPLYAQENGIQGTVHVQFTIDKNGKKSNISIIRGVDESLDRETFRLIHSMSDWAPAKLNGKNIDVYLIIPISYRLQ